MLLGNIAMLTPTKRPGHNLRNMSQGFHGVSSTEQDPMSRTPARITQADVARAIRAAQQTGAGAVRILPDGTIRIDPQPDSAGGKPQNQVEDDEEVVL